MLLIIWVKNGNFFQKCTANSLDYPDHSRVGCVHTSPVRVQYKNVQSVQRLFSVSVVCHIRFAKAQNRRVPYHYNDIF